MARWRSLMSICGRSIPTTMVIPLASRVKTSAMSVPQNQVGWATTNSPGASQPATATRKTFTTIRIRPIERSRRRPVSTRMIGRTNAPTSATKSAMNRSVSSGFAPSARAGPVKRRPVNGSV